MARTPPKRKATYHHGDLRRVLLRTAHDLLDAGGADRLSLRDLAKRAKVSTAAPYRHFADKAALLSAMAEEGFEELEARMKAAALNADPAAKLLGLASTYLELAVRRPHFFRMMFSADLGPSRTQEGIFRACDRVFASLLAIFVEGQQAKRWRAGPAEEQALLFWSALHGYAMLLIDRRFEDANFTAAQHQAFLHKLLSDLLRGLGRPG